MWITSVTIIVLLLGIVLGGHGFDVDDDDDDDIGFGSALSGAFDRVKTREIERLLQTAWCVVKGPVCASRRRRGVATGGVPVQPHDYLVTAINSFSSCVCSARSFGHKCTLPIPLNLLHNQHFNQHTSFSLVFFWLGAVKDFFCYVTLENVVTCDFSQRLNVPSSSQPEIANFVRTLQGEITQKSDCSEFCSRFRCIYEAWNTHGMTTPFRNIYDKCVNEMCRPSSTSLPSTTSTTTPTAMATESVTPATVKPPPSLPKTVAVTPLVNRTVILPGEDNSNPDAAEQDGGDKGGEEVGDPLVAGLVGGMLALIVLGLAMVFLLAWRRKHKSKKQDIRTVHHVTFVNPGEPQPESSRQTNHNHQTHITAVNQLAARGMLTVNRSESSAKLMSSDSDRRLSEDDTYATLSECQMNGPYDNPGYDHDLTLNKGEELVLSQGSKSERLYTTPTCSSSSSKQSTCTAGDDQYLEPLPETDRYVAYPPQYLEPVVPNREEYLEPVPLSEAGRPGQSYMTMESSISGGSRPSDIPTDDTQYEQIDVPDQEPSYYNATITKSG